LYIFLKKETGMKWMHAFGRCHGKDDSWKLISI